MATNRTLPATNSSPKFNESVLHKQAKNFVSFVSFCGAFRFRNCIVPVGGEGGRKRDRHARTEPFRIKGNRPRPPGLLHLQGCRWDCRHHVTTTVTIRQIGDGVDDIPRAQRTAAACENPATTSVSRPTPNTKSATAKNCSRAFRHSCESTNPDRACAAYKDAARSPAR